MKIGEKEAKEANFLIDLLFPNYCLGCHQRGFYICPSCLEKIDKPNREISKNIWSVFDYRDPLIRKAIWELKYYHRYQLAYQLGVLLYNYSLEKLSFLAKETSDPVIVIPIPMSRRKQWKRGYNQAFHIARGFCEKINPNTVSLEKNILIKKIKTPPQAKIKNKYSRIKNVQGSFKVKNKDKIKGKTILIIDDVVTTGATVKEAGRVLKKAGAKKIYAFTLAH